MAFAMLGLYRRCAGLSSVAFKSILAVPKQTPSTALTVKFHKWRKNFCLSSLFLTPLSGSLLSMFQSQTNYVLLLRVSKPSWILPLLNATLVKLVPILKGTAHTTVLPLIHTMMKLQQAQLDRVTSCLALLFFNTYRTFYFSQTMPSDWSRVWFFVIILSQL